MGDLYSARQLGRPRALQEYLIALSLDIADISPAEMNRIRWNIARISHEMGNWDQAIDYYTKVYESTRGTIRGWEKR